MENKNNKKEKKEFGWYLTNVDSINEFPNCENKNGFGDYLDLQNDEVAKIQRRCREIEEEMDHQDEIDRQNSEFNGDERI